MHFADFLQLFDAVADKAEHLVVAAQADILLPHPETCVRQDLQHQVLALGVPQEQLFALVQGDLFLHRQCALFCL